MPIRYVGRTTYQEGKRLHDILGKLKNFGVGRVVYRNVLKNKYEEPSFIKITGVIPRDSKPGFAADYLHEGQDHSLNVEYVGIKVGRGELLGEAAFKKAYQPDWRLVPKSEEHKFLNYEFKKLPRKENPVSVPFPPLLEIFAKRQLERENKPVPDGPMCLEIGDVQRKMRTHDDDPALKQRLQEAHQ